MVGCAASEPPSDAAAAPASPCTGEHVIAPPDAHYCFALPAGFDDVSATARLNIHGGEPTATSMVAVAGRDFVAVAEIALQENSDTLSSEQLSADMIRPGDNSDGVMYDASPQETRIDEARAFHVHIWGQDYAVEFWVAYRGYRKFFITCQSVAQVAAVERACTEVHNTLQLE